MATKADIRNRAAESLGILPIGQALENQYKTRIDTGYGEVYAVLKEEGIAYWSISADVPEKFAPAVISLVARNCLTLGTTTTRRDLILNAAGVDGEKAHAIIRRLGAEKYKPRGKPPTF